MNCSQERNIQRLQTVHITNTNTDADTATTTTTTTTATNSSSKGKGSSLDIAPLTILDSGTLQPRKWQLIDNDCSTAAHAVAAQSPW